MATYAPSGFKVDAFLCDSAVVADGKLFLHGGGWNILNSPRFPFAQDRIGIAAVISVPYTATNTMHVLELWLQDLDGKHRPIGISPGPDGQPSEQMKLVANFNHGRPPALPPGEPQSMPFAVNLDNIVFPAPGGYTFVLTIDNEEMARLPFRIVSPPGFPAG